MYTPKGSYAIKSANSYGREPKTKRIKHYFDLFTHSHVLPTFQKVTLLNYSAQQSPSNKGHGLPERPKSQSGSNLRC
jgi:hypothetical protein